MVPFSQKRSVHEATTGRAILKNPQGPRPSVIGFIKSLAVGLFECMVNQIFPQQSLAQNERDLGFSDP